MTRWIRKKAANVRIGRALVLLTLCGLLANEAFGDGVALFTTAKTLPDATVAVIDPEGGSSGGTAGSDVRIAAGDIILYRFQFAPVPDKVNRGMNSYLTEYVPPGTEVVGVRFIDDDGRTIVPRLPGLAVDGCAGGSLCTNFNDLACSGGSGCSGNLRDIAGGSIAQVHAETGIFFSSDPRTARTPNNVFLTPNNGISMIEPDSIDPELAPLLELSDPFFAHNHWDYDQVLAFGIANANGNRSGNSGKGNGPYLYGSPVAGPHSFYPFEATEVGASDTTNTIHFNNVVGPWSRIQYPGSMVGVGNCVDTSRINCNPEAPGTGGRAVVPAATASHCGATGTAACLGSDVTPANPATANAVRFALGESRTGMPGTAEIALRVKPGGVPLDPNFGGVGANVNCMETTGSNIAMRDTGNRGDSIQWGSYIGSPACAFLRTLLTIDADTDLALGSGGFEDINYTLRVKNLSVNPETNVVVRQRWNSSRGAFVSVTGGPTPTGPASCPAPNGGLQCLTWNLGTMAPSDEVVITTHFTAGGAGGGTLVMEAAYASTELTALSGTDFTTRDVTVIKAIALPEIDLAPAWDPTLTFIPGDGSGTATLTGTVANNGTTSFTYDEINPILPAGWSLANNRITVGGVNYSCTPAASATPVCDLSSAFAAGESRTLSMTLNVPAAATALYDLDIQFWGSQSSFGGGFETYLADLATVNVGAVRTERPILICPILSSVSQVSGTAEPNADVTVRFNLMPRADVTANGGGGWQATSFDDYGPFGQMYGGLEVSAVAQLAGELLSEPAVPCDATPSRACADGVDNDGDGLADFPADPGCSSLFDNDESDDPECGDGIGNDGDGLDDWPADPDCYGPNDPTESPECSDGIDNDGDGNTDFPNDTECTSATDKTEGFVNACQDLLDNDGDGQIDFPDDPGCHSAFDNDEADVTYNPSDIKPRLMIVFDTSGSMNWNTCESEFTGGDGSLDCAGADVACADLPGTCTGGSTLSCDNSVADDSRMLKVKDGLSSVVGSFGEAEFGLMRFTQRGMTWGCPGSNASAQSGGWQGGGAAPCPLFGGGDLVVGFSLDNSQSILDYLDGETNYPIGDPPPTLDNELRGTGTTPIAGALIDARTELAAAFASDAIAACRPYRVILVTDGEETCGGDPVAAAATLAGDQMYVTVIGFAIDDPAVVTELNGIANAGSASGSDPAIFVDDSTQLSAAIAQVITDAIKFETCNGVDDDCDGETDEDFTPPLGDACTNGQLGVCSRDGAFVCTMDEQDTVCDAPDGSSSSTSEVCNILDDDCDGKVDEGLTCNCLNLELCNGADDDCDGTIDENVSGVGATCGIDFGACEFGSIECVDPDSNPGTQNSHLDCVGGVGPAANDVCDGVDNDCDCIADTDMDMNLCDPGDVNVDEDPGPECYPAATDGCTPDGSGGYNCLGLCRPGEIECVGGAPGGCVGFTGPTTEVCNGFDESCTGTADDPWVSLGLGNTCDNGLLGECRATGILTCPNDPTDTSQVKCTAPTVSPGAEICDGKDNDCDGAIDETTNPFPDGLDTTVIGQPCGGAGGCSPGTLQCVDPDMDPLTQNSGIECVGTTGGTDEVCNGADDDCDTRVDEFIAGVGADCYPSGTPGCTPDGSGGFDCEGSCAPGATICVPPQIVCDGATGPAPEDTCDGVDNDCDGAVDEDPCPVAGDICLEGECISPCMASEFPCPFGERCQTLPDTACPTPPCRYCVDDLCAGVNCPSGEQCDEDSGQCIDLCDNVSCGMGETCSFGFCLDCIALPCPSGDVCRIGTGCVPDPCADVACADDEFCDEGSCVALTCDPACAPGEQCVEGTCVEDLCDGVVCPVNQVCNPTSGDCVGDLCLGLVCPAGQACNPSTGECIDDPCRFTSCPPGFFCEVDFDGTSSCTERDPDEDAEYVTAAGGGCLDASNGGGSSTTALVLMLLGAALARRRRRGRAGQAFFGSDGTASSTSTKAP